MKPLVNRLDLDLIEATAQARGVTAFSGTQQLAEVADQVDADVENALAGATYEAMEPRWKG